ncbi:hypothetical protein ACE939_08740 [Aquimarina sp. W85]|uniref:hypothetical protein n=1 Tax=Aquimarina rhodophyticola TaxID=3342246 RepID=UPI0036731E8F
MNYANSEQYGISNEIQLEQSGGSVSSVGEFYQYGEYQKSSMTQQGLENSAKIFQGDIDNQSLYGYNEVEQSREGNNNIAEIHQIKIEEGYIVQTQIGTGNNVIASQNINFQAEVNSISQFQNGNNNTMLALQDKNEGMQYFSNNFIGQTQLGDGNVMSSIQLGTQNNAYLTQNGDFNSLETTQIGSDNMLTITQNGNSNALIIAQGGSGHVNTIMQ